MGLRCKRCGSEEHVKNGLMRGQQRYLCKDCGLNFTDTPPRGKPLVLKAAAVLLYVSGLSMHRTAQLLGVSTPTIQAWLEQWICCKVGGGLRNRPGRVQIRPRSRTGSRRRWPEPAYRPHQCSEPVPF